MEFSSNLPVERTKIFTLPLCTSGDILADYTRGFCYHKNDRFCNHRAVWRFHRTEARWIPELVSASQVGKFGGWNAASIKDRPGSKCRLTFFPELKKDRLHTNSKFWAPVVRCPIPGQHLWWHGCGGWTAASQKGHWAKTRAGWQTMG